MFIRFFNFGEICGDILEWFEIEEVNVGGLLKMV